MSSLNRPTELGTNPAKPVPELQQSQGFPHVGIIGLGHMGQVLAAILAQAKCLVSAYDLDSHRVDALRLDGVRAATKLADLAACDIVITCLPDDAAVESVTMSEDGLLGIMHPEALHLGTSTISPALARRLAKAHREASQHYATAALLGNPDLARTQRLFVLLAGAPLQRHRARTILDKLSQRVFELGDDPGAANLMKLACNALTAATMQSFGEVFALLRKSRIDPAAAFEVFVGSLFDGRVHKAYGGKIVEERYRPAGMQAPLAVKDLRLVLAEADRTSVPMPVTGLVHDRLIALVAAGWGELDWSALGALAARDAGLPQTAGG